MRRIFSTVFGPHEPALTVGSLAISATGRPSTSPTPVTTPSAPQPLLLPVGQQRLLGEAALVEQPRDPLAHRELALLRGLLVVALRAARERSAGGCAQIAHPLWLAAPHVPRRDCLTPVGLQARVLDRRASPE